MEMIEDFEAAELAAAILEQEEPETDDEIDAIEAELVDRFGVDLEQFASLPAALLPFCTKGVSALTGRAHRGFARDDRFIVKTEVVVDANHDHI